MQSTPPVASTLWPMPAFTFQAFASIDDTAIESWRKFMGLNADFTRSMFEETQFDWASCFVPQEPEELYARQWSSQFPFMSIPLHYATAMVELAAATQRAWMDSWGHMLGLPMLLPVMPVMPVMSDIAAAAPDGDVEDVPAAAIRETPRKGKAG